MNKVYKIVWNASHQVWVAVSELARGKVKSSSKTLSVGLGIILLPAQFALATPGIRDLPSFNNIASGSATLTTTTGNLTVDQSSSKLIANWNSFNVGSAAKVTFNQPDASSIALNRISSAAPSEIFGRVTANGKLILVNPAGLTIGSTGQISAASVIASTLNISDADFNAGSLIFDRGTATGEINNQGTILATTGSTALLAPTIRNAGTTRAISGNVTLANGNRLTVADTTVTLNQSSGIPGLIQSSGTIRADRLATTNGKVYLVGDRARAGSLVQLAGTLTSSGVDVKGKTVEVTGALETNSSTNINAINSININGAINVVGNNRLIGLVHGTGAGEGYFLGSAGKISMPGTGDKFRVNGQYFKLIQTLAQLQGIGANATTLADQTYVIANDIDASSTATTSFTPLGNTATAFTGVINGLGNNINNLTVNKPAQDHVGFVGYATSGALKNIRLVNASITGRNHVGGLVGSSYNEGAGDSLNPAGKLNLSNNFVSGTVKGKYRVGGLLGYGSINGLGGSAISGNTTNADVSGDNQVGGQVGAVEVFSGNFLLTGGQVNGLTHATTTTGGKYNIGGLMGILSSDADSIVTVSDSVVNGAVSSTRATSELGGVFGRVNNYGNATTTLQNIQNNGGISVFSDGSNQSTYIGGLLGVAHNFGSNINQFMIDGLSNTVNVSAGSNGSYVGGLIGYANGITVTDSNSNAAISGAGILGGLLGYAYGSTISSSTAAGSINGTDSVGGLIGSADTVNFSGNTASNTVSGSSNVGGMTGYSLNSTLTNNTATGNVSGIDLVGGLVGQANQTIVTGSNATGNISGSRAGGLIGYLSGTGSIASSHATGDVTSTGSAGGLIGENYGSSISNSYAEGTVSGATYVGGLVGYNEGSIDQSHAIGAVSGTGQVGGLVGSFYAYNGTDILNSYATGAVTAEYYAGGLIGYLQMPSSVNTDISNNYATGNVNMVAGTNGNSFGGLIGQVESYSSDSTLNINTNYASGVVTASSAVGGLIGNLYAYYTTNNTINVFNSYATGNVSGSSQVGGLIGSQTAGSVSNSHANGNVVGDMDTGGLIGYATSNNGTLQITRNYATGSVQHANAGAGQNLGGLIGKVDNYNGLVNITENSASGNVLGELHLGGLIGHLYAGYVDNTSTKKLNVLNNFATGTVTGNNTVGGFIGGSHGEQSNIYLTSNYSSGLVTGTDTSSTGGFIGSAYDGSGTSFITKDYWNKTSSGQTVAIGYKQLNRTATVTGLTAVQMNQQASFVGWDISSLATGSSSIWYINEGVSAPVLRSLMTP